MGIRLWRLLGAALDDQIPQDKYCAQSRGRKERITGRACSACTFLELFIPLSDTLGGLERVGNQLVDVRRLRREVADEHVLELGNLDERALGGPASWLEG